MTASRLATCFIVLFATSVKAEYRVFSLVISNEKTQVTKQVETTLDPDQYVTLYPLNQGEKISYVDTWKCLGRTDFFKSHCAEPSRVPATIGKLDQKPAANPSQSPEVPRTP